MTKYNKFQQRGIMNKALYILKRANDPLEHIVYYADNQLDLCSYLGCTCTHLRACLSRNLQIYGYLIEKITLPTETRLTKKYTNKIDKLSLLRFDFENTFRKSLTYEQNLLLTKKQLSILFNRYLLERYHNGLAVKGICG